jgi:hypothetical protein
MKNNLNCPPIEASCGWFNPKTGESGTFVDKNLEQEYNNLPWYKKILTPKPAAKVTQSNPYLTPEFYEQIEYTQNYIERGIFCRTRHFSMDGAVNVFVEKNRYEPSLNRYFYIDGERRIYLDRLALEQGIIVENPDLLK